MKSTSTLIADLKSTEPEVVLDAINSGNTKVLDAAIYIIGDTSLEFYMLAVRMIPTLMDKAIDYYSKLENCKAFGLFLFLENTNITKNQVQKILGYLTLDSLQIFKKTNYGLPNIKKEFTHLLAQKLSEVGFDRWITNKSLAYNISPLLRIMLMVQQLNPLIPEHVSLVKSQLRTSFRLEDMSNSSKFYYYEFVYCFHLHKYFGIDIPQIEDTMLNIK